MSKPPESIIASVTSLADVRKRRAKPDLPALPVHGAAKTAVPADAMPLLGLTASRKLFLCLGRGRVGKSTLLRWIYEMVSRPEGSLALWAIDPGRRRLQDFLDGVATPEPDANVVEWLQDYIDLLADPAVTMSAMLDAGGDNPEILKLLNRQPGLASALSERGVETVMAVMFGPARDEADLLRQLHAAQFFPSATLLVMNLRLATDRAQFDALRDEPAYRAILKDCTDPDLGPRNCAEVFMPINHASLAVDNRFLGFRRAASPDGPLGWLDRGPVERWLVEMDEAFAAVKQAGWLP